MQMRQHGELESLGSFDHLRTLGQWEFQCFDHQGWENNSQGAPSQLGAIWSCRPTLPVWPPVIFFYGFFWHPMFMWTVQGPYKIWRPTLLGSLEYYCRKYFFVCYVVDSLLSFGISKNGNLARRKVRVLQQIWNSTFIKLRHSKIFYKTRLRSVTFLIFKITFKNMIIQKNISKYVFEKYKVQNQKFL